MLTALKSETHFIPCFIVDSAAFVFIWIFLLLTRPWKVMKVHSCEKEHAAENRAENIFFFFLEKESRIVTQNVGIKGQKRTSKMNRNLIIFFRGGRKKALVFLVI